MARDAAKPDAAESLFRRARRCTRDDRKALSYYLAAASLGHAEAQWQAGRRLARGWGAKPDPAAGIPWIEKAAAQGLGDAHWQLALFHEEGVGVAKDARRALYHAMRGWAADRTAHCATIAADIYEELGQHERSFKWYLRGAKGGDPDAMTSLGVCYRYGRGVAQDLRAGVWWYREAARLGCPHAHNNLAICYKNGEGVPIDRRAAFRWRKKAADLGHDLSKLVVAAWRIDGFGVRRDVAKGLAQMQRLARRDPEAAWELGDRWLEGNGIPQDRRRGVRWLRIAARLGSVEAVNSLGVCTFYGRGVRKDHAKAVAFYRESAARGNGVAWSNLGLCYREGQGVERDEEKARECFANARANGYHIDDRGKSPAEDCAPRRRRRSARDVD